MKKGLLKIVSTLLIAMVCKGINAQETSGSCGYPKETDVTWSYDGGTLTFTGTGAMNMYSEDMPQAPWWDDYFETATTVVVGEGITTIPHWGFAMFENLSSVTLPSTLTTIGKAALEECAFTTIDLPEGLITIGDYAFQIGKLTTVTIPSTVTYIGEVAFQAMESLTSVTFLNTDPTTITFGENIFQACDNLTAIYVPATVVDAYQTALPAYASLIVEGGAPSPATSGSCGDNATWSYESTTLTISGTGAMDDYAYGEAPWIDYAEEMTSLVIESGITSVGNNAFAGCEKLNSVQYPATGFTSIGDYAFSGCKVKYVTLPKTLTTLGEGAFSGCQTRSVSIPGSVKIIGDYAFNGCKLEGIGIYEGVEEIGEGAFDDALNNESEETFSIFIPNTVTKIGGGAFMSNTALETVTFGEGLVEIGDAAFQGCTGLKEVGLFCNKRPALGEAVFTEYDGETLLEIEAFYYPYGLHYDGWGGYDSDKFKDSFYGTWTYYDRDASYWDSELGKYVEVYDASKGSGNWSFEVRERKLTITGKGILNVSPWNDEPVINPMMYPDEEHPGFWGGVKTCAIGKGITEIDGMICGMQINCTSVTLPNTLKRISGSALEECAFTSISLPEGLDSIDMYAFFGSKLTALTIPGTVTYIGASSFLYNQDLAVVTMLPTTPPELYTDELPFGECEKLTSIYVPEGCADAYKAADGWSTYADLIKDAPTTTFTYTATEKVAKFDDNLDSFEGAISVKSHEFDGTNGTVVYSGYVTGIGELALSYTKMTGITIPESVTAIGSGAFQSSKLATVTFAGTPTITTIGARAFNSCSALTAFTVPATVESIGASAFAYCSELANVTFDGTPTITTIGNNAFGDCKKLTSFTIPESVTTLGTTVFWFAGLTMLHIPAGVTSIGQALYCSCPLISLTVDAANPKYADLGCNGIFEKSKNKLVTGGAATTVPDGIVAIGEEAFWGEEGEFSLVLPESVTTIESRAFHMARGLKEITIPSGITFIDEECFAFCETVEDVYCYADVDAITWGGGMAMPAFNMMTPKATKFHVTDTDAWSTKFPDANVTFVEGLPTPVISTEKEMIELGEWHSIDGRRLPGAPSERGIYIRDNKKVVIW